MNFLIVAGGLDVFAQYHVLEMPFMHTGKHQRQDVTSLAGRADTSL